MNQDKVNLYFVLFHFLGHPAGYAVGEDGLYYKHHSEMKNWADASRICKSEGGHLAIEDSRAIHSYMVKAFGNKGQFWIGLSDTKKEGQWVWVNDENLGKGYWHSAQPDNAGGNQDCAVYNWGGKGTWDDQNCLDQKAFLCQFGTSKNTIWSSTLRTNLKNFQKFFQKNVFKVLFQNEKQFTLTQKDSMS